MVRGDFRMAELSIGLEPRSGDVRAFVASSPQDRDASLICGLVVISLDSAQLEIGTLDERSYEERGGVPLAFLSDLISEALIAGQQIMESKAGDSWITLAEAARLHLQPKGASVRVEVVGFLRAQGLRLGRSARKETLLLAGEVTHASLAGSLAEAANSLLRRVQELGPQIQPKDLFGARAASSLRALEGLGRKSSRNDSG